MHHTGPSFQQPTYGKGTSLDHQRPPTELQALDALGEIQNLLRPLHPGKQKRYKESKVEAWGKKVLKELKVFFNLITAANSKVKGRWMEASKQAAVAACKPTKHQERKLREEAKKFISTHDVPKNPYGAWSMARIDANEELAQEINIYLQEKGKYVKANDIAEYLNKPEVQPTRT